MDPSQSFAAWFAQVWAGWSDAAPAVLFLLLCLLVLTAVPLMIWRIKIAERQAGRDDEWAREKLEQEASERFARAAELAVHVAQDKFKQARAADAATLEATEKTQHQRDTRYAKAIDQLGADESQIPVRVGGIYTLGAIAKEVPDSAQTIQDILTAYIREESPRELEEGERITRRAIPGGRTVTYFHHRPRRGDGQLTLNEAHVVPYPMPEDVRAALSVIITRNKHADASMKGLDLSFTDLRGADLSRANLAHANLVSADLRYANLAGANLTGAKLDGARLEHSTLTGVYMMDAELAFARFDYANMDDAVLDEAAAFSTSFAGVTFRRVCARRAKLVRCNLSRIVATHADLDGADLTRSNLEGAELVDCKNLANRQLKAATLNAETKLPENLSHLISGAAAEQAGTATERVRARGGRGGSS